MKAASRDHVRIVLASAELELRTEHQFLHRMEQHGWITAAWSLTENNRRARLYKLTRAGEKRLAEEEAKWTRLIEAVGKLLRYA